MLEHRGPVWRYAPAALGTTLLVAAAVVGTQLALVGTGNARAPLSPYGEGGFTVGAAAVDRRVTITSADDGSYVLGYTPAGGDVVLDLDMLSGDTLQPWWYDPATGRTLKMRTLDSEGVARFPAPKEGGGPAWVLVVDDVAAGYGAPDPDVIAQATGEGQSSGGSGANGSGTAAGSSGTGSGAVGAGSDGSTGSGEGTGSTGSATNGAAGAGSGGSGSGGAGAGDSGGSGATGAESAGSGATGSGSGASGSSGSGASSGGGSGSGDGGSGSGGTSGGASGSTGSTGSRSGAGGTGSPGTNGSSGQGNSGSGGSNAACN